MQCFLKAVVGIFLVCLLAVALALPTLAQTARSVTWEDLRSSTTVQLDDPYKHLTQQQLYDLAYLVSWQEANQQSTEPNPQATASAQRLEQKLQDQGLEVDELLAQVARAREYYRQKAQATNTELEGQTILLQGYLLPLDTQFGSPASEFLLVPYVGACIHVPQPPPNQIVYLKLSETIKTPRGFTLVAATGILERRGATYDLFWMDGTQQVDVNYALTQAAIALNPPSLPDWSMLLEQGSEGTSWQTKASNYLTQMLTQMGARPSPQLLGFGLLIAFSYGVLHTLGPGHGKTVIVSYFIGEGGSWRRGILMGIRIAVFHVLSAVIGVVLLHAILQQTIQDSATHYRIVKIISYGAIALIGATMLQRSLRKVVIKPGPQTWEAGSARLLYPTLADSLILNADAELAEDPLGPTHPDYRQPKPKQQAKLGVCNCFSCWQPNRRQNRQERKLRSWLAVAIGAVPCSGAILILLFGLANNFLWFSILMVIAISLGMAVTLSGIGIMAIWGRTLLARRFVHKRQQPQRFVQFLQILASGSILVVAMSLLGYTLVS